MSVQPFAKLSYGSILAFALRQLAVFVLWLATLALALALPHIGGVVFYAGLVTLSVYGWVNPVLLLVGLGIAASSLVAWKLLMFESDRWAWALALMFSTFVFFGAFITGSNILHNMGG